MALDTKGKALVLLFYCRVVIPVTVPSFLHTILIFSLTVAVNIVRTLIFNKNEFHSILKAKIKSVKNVNFSQYILKFKIVNYFNN